MVKDSVPRRVSERTNNAQEGGKRQAFLNKLQWESGNKKKKQKSVIGRRKQRVWSQNAPPPGEKNHRERKKRKTKIMIRPGIIQWVYEVKKPAVQNERTIRVKASAPRGRKVLKNK